MTMHILIAPNAFKNSLDAPQVAAAIAKGLILSKLQCTTESFPIADGGDGTGSLIIERCKGEVIWKEVHDPLGRKIKASFGLIENRKTAVIEMANASGLRLLKKGELNPMLTSSYGTGDLMRYALDEGVNKIVLAMGGSATVDGGCGILRALGIKFLNADGDQLLANPESLMNLYKIDTSALDKRILDCELVILCDVNNKLLGPRGAAAIFGPQKGASPEQVQLLDNFLNNFSKVSEKQMGIDMSAIEYGGAAGGATAGLYTWLNAKLVNGIDHFMTLTNFDDTLQKADLVITGEGSIDEQTLQGKGPYGVAIRAKRKNIKVIGMAGKIPIERNRELEKYFDVLVPINNEPSDMAVALADTEKNLVRTAILIGNLLASVPKKIS